MKKRNSSVFGLIAFAVGTLIIVLAYILLMPLFSFNPVAYTFSFVSILLTYILFFLPMFFGPFTGDVYKRQTVSRTMTTAPVRR